jgi:hypothetical protein
MTTPEDVLGNVYIYIKPPQRYFHLDVVEGLACPGNPESYAGGSLATGRISKPDRSIWVGTRQREIPWSSRLGVGREANNLTP